jgi:signal transduction histidine kinase
LRWWAGYFAVSLGIWLAEWRLDAGFEWVVWAYLGQMFGVLPPRFSLPACGAVVLAYLSMKFGWSKLGQLGFVEWFGILSLTTAGTTLGVFLHKLTTTSTERAQLIHELEAAQKELELARQRDAELAALCERERLARALHDSLGHSLVTLTVQLEAAQRLTAVDPARAAALLEEMKHLTRASMDDLRRSLANLRAPGLGDRPLAQAIEGFCAEVGRRAGVAVDCQLADATDHLTPAVAEALWRVAQEGLTNVEKHAKARHAQVHLSRLPQAIVLRVADDGVGLPADAERKPGHYGLRGLRERVEGLGGTLTVATATTGGAVVEARIPMIP